MFQVGEQVMYGVHGVCTVACREQRRIDRKDVMYLVLEPLGQKGSRYYVPVQNQAAMSKLRPMLSAEALSKLLDSEEIHKDIWVNDENRRKQMYRNLMTEGQRVTILQMVNSLYLHKNAQAAAGRKVHLCDENFLREAEKLVISEISAVMGLDQEQSRLLLREKLR